MGEVAWFKIKSNYYYEKDRLNADGELINKEEEDVFYKIFVEDFKLPKQEFTLYNV